MRGRRFSKGFRLAIILGPSHVANSTYPMDMASVGPWEAISTHEDCLKEDRSVTYICKRWQEKYFPA